MMQKLWQLVEPDASAFSLVTLSPQVL